MDWKKVLDGLKSKEIPMRSELNLMNEKRQERIKGASLRKFTYEWKKKSRIVIPMQIAIPFNPMTGVPDEEFNPNTKWRPPISASTAASIIKSFCGENEDAKNVFMSRAGVSEWDVSNPGELNEIDLKVLRKYRVPIMLTVDVVSINDSVITGQSFAIPYSVNVEYDFDTGAVVGELPAIAKMGNFMSSVIFNEINELGEAIKQKDPKIYQGGNPDIAPASIPEADEKQQKKWNSSIFGSAIISSPQPKNFLIAYEFPLSMSSTMLESGTVLPEYVSLNPADLKLREVYFDASKKYRDYINEVLESESMDHFFDIIEFDLCDSTSKEPKTNDEKARASGDLKPANPSHAFYNIDDQKVRFPWVSDLISALVEYRDSDPNFEKKMMAFLATRIKAADQTVTSAVADRIQERLPIGNRYIKKETLSAHKDAMSLIYGEEYIGLVMEDPDAVEAAESAGKQEVSDAAALLKEIAETSETPEAVELPLE